MLRVPDQQASTDDARSTEELAAAAAAGASDCFETIVRRMGPRLLGYLHRSVGDAHLAEDLLQETFLRAYRNLGRFDPSRSFRAWVFTIAANLAASHCRRRPQPASMADMDPPGRQGPHPADALADREAARGLWEDASRLLPEGQFTALWLRFAEQMSIAEVAAATRRSAGAVKVLLHRACRKLTQHVTGQAARAPAAARPAATPRLSSPAESYRGAP